MAPNDRSDGGPEADERIAELARLLERRSRANRCSECGQPAIASSLDTRSGEVRHYCKACLEAEGD